jgi:putative endonuclease
VSQIKITIADNQQLILKWCQTQEILVFVEVKSKTYTYYGAPEESISSHKERLLVDAAGRYMEQINHDWEIRFDIISIVFDKNMKPTISHYKDAFYPSF